MSELHAWVDKTTGEIFPFHPDFPPEGKDATTHDLLEDLPDGFFEGSLDWDTATRAFITPPPPVPETVTPLQMRKAIRVSGLKATLDAFADTQSEEVIEAWEYALQIERNNDMIEAARVALGWTVEQADDLFRLAATQ